MRRALPLCALLFAAQTFAKPAGADDAADLQGVLDQPIVTAASRSAEADSVAPATSSVISGEELRRYGMHTVGEALNFLAMGVVGTSPQGLDTDDFGARGVAITGDVGAHFLVLVNGHPANTPLGGGATELTTTHMGIVWLGRALGIPLETIDHIEVMLGPGSVLYGSNAMLGVVDIITKSADTFSGAHVAVDSELATSVRGFAGGASHFSALGARGELTAGLEYYRAQGPNLYFTPQREPSGVWGGTATHNTLEVPSGVVHASLGHLEFDGRATLKQSSMPVAGLGATTFDLPSSYERERRLSLSLKYRSRIASKAEVTARLSYDSTDFQSSYTYVAPVTVPSVGTLYSGRGELSGTYDWLDDGKLVTLIGAEALYVRLGELVTSMEGSSTLGVVAHLRHDDMPVAAYAQQTWRPNPILGLNAGVRVDYDQRFDPVASPRFAAAIEPWRHGTLKLIYSEAFRAPTLNETYEAWTGVRIAAPGLVPERVRSAEAILQQDFSAQHLRMGVFFSEWRDLIYFHTFTAAEGRAGIGLAGYSQEQNRGSISNPGYNASFDGSLDGGNLRYGISVTGAIARIDGGDALAVAPRVFGNARVSYDLPGDWPVLALAGYFMGSRQANAPFESTLAATTMPIVAPQVMLRPTISGPVPHVRGLSYRATANFALATHDPYLVGPSAATSPNASQLTPVETFRATVGLQYDLY